MRVQELPNGGIRVLEFQCRRVIVDARLNKHRCVLRVGQEVVWDEIDAVAFWLESVVCDTRLTIR